MRKKVFQHAGALIIAAIILTFFTMSWAMYNNTAEQLRVSVRNECEYYRYFLDKMGDDSLDKPAGKITASRVTLIDTDGTVLFDSVEDENMMGNHSGRPEVIEAEKTGESNISRYSETLRSKTYYTALRLDNGKIIRVSLTTDSVFGVMLRNIWLVVVLIAAVLVVELLMVSHMTKALVKPINEIDLNHPLDNKAYEELSPLLGRIHQQQKQIQQQMEELPHHPELRHNQEEYLAITEYMKDGLIVTNQSVVLSINRSAQNLFDVTAEECINHNIVTVSRNEQLKEALDHALEGSSEERMLEINGRVYQLLANPVRVDRVVSGAVILVLDVTEKQKAEVMRREFSANVSHELKTPLTSISGNASNLLSNADYFDKETKKQLYLDIYDDSMWLINLIENMLSVTRLEEGRMNLNISVELVDDVIQEALRHVDRKKDEHTITVEHEDELLLARMDSRLIVQMVINLVDNAIKYTQKGSHIDIRTGREGKNAVISVADDGPGISDEMKEHIFETFYTGTNKIADSRRSLGLGLALCKSIVNVHGGEIKVSDAHPHGAVFQFTLPAGEVYLYEQTTDTGCGR